MISDLGVSMTDDTRPVHPAWLRATHWLNALAVVILAMSGWRIYNAAHFSIHSPRSTP